jgi:hypothetical protein
MLQGRFVTLSILGGCMTASMASEAVATDAAKLISPLDGATLNCPLDKLHIDVEPTPETKIFEIQIKTAQGGVVKRGIRLSQGIDSQWNLKEFAPGETYGVQARWVLPGAQWGKARTFKVGTVGPFPGTAKQPEIFSPAPGQHFPLSKGVVFKGSPHPDCPLLIVKLQIKGAEGTHNLNLHGDTWAKGWTSKSGLYKKGSHSVTARFDQFEAKPGTPTTFEIVD